MNKEEWYTPEWIMKDLGEFDLDVCAPEGGISWIPAKKYYTKVDDGLTQKWVGRVWCNPPFRQAGKWMTKFIEHRNGVALCPISKTKWFDRIVADPNFVIEILPSTLQFYTSNGMRSVRTSCCLVKVTDRSL